jgi:hypothetical protein
VTVTRSGLNHIGGRDVNLPTKGFPAILRVTPLGADHLGLRLRPTDGIDDNDGDPTLEVLAQAKYGILDTSSSTGAASLVLNRGTPGAVLKRTTSWPFSGGVARFQYNPSTYPTTPWRSTGRASATRPPPPRRGRGSAPSRPTPSTPTRAR